MTQKLSHHLNQVCVGCLDPSVLSFSLITQTPIYMYSPSPLDKTCPHST
jgi:hypothetical protein